MTVRDIEVRSIQFGVDATPAEFDTWLFYETKKMTTSGPAETYELEIRLMPCSLDTNGSPNLKATRTITVEGPIVEVETGRELGFIHFTLRWAYIADMGYTRVGVTCYGPDDPDDLEVVVWVWDDLARRIMRAHPRASITPITASPYLVSHHAAARRLRAERPDSNLPDANLNSAEYEDIERDQSEQVTGFPGAGRVADELYDSAAEKIKAGRLYDQVYAEYVEDLTELKGEDHVKTYADLKKTFNAAMRKRDAGKSQIKANKAK